MFIKNFPKFSGSHGSSALVVALAAAALARLSGIASASNIAGRPNFDPLHQPALNPQSSGSTLLVTDNALFTDQTGTQGLTNWVYPIGADSNYVDEGLGNALPAGEHEMYNDGSVAWVPMSKIKVRFIWADTFYYGW